MSAKVTSLDVARRAGVSQSAVSRVYTKGASASAQTAKKVRKAAAELGYRPNILARSVKTGKSRIIGLIVAYLNNQFYPDALEKLSNRLQQEGYHVLVFMANNEAQDIETVVEEILDYQVDGIVAASVGMSSDLADRCAAAGVPLVLFNRWQDGGFSAVTSDNYAGGKAVAQHLAALGHTDIGYIAGWEGASTQLEREEGFRDGLAECKLELSHREVGNFNEARARQATRDMFDCENRPSAVFVANDHMALETLDVLRFELGLRVPEDVSVVGFDDVPMSARPSYNLTTMRQPANKMVEETVRLLLGNLSGEAPLAERVKIEAPMIVRGTTASPRKAVS